MGGISLGVAGAAIEHPLEGVAEDPAGRVIQKTPTRMSGRDYKGGAGAGARGNHQTKPYTSSIEAWYSWSDFTAPWPLRAAAMPFTVL